MSSKVYFGTDFEKVLGKTDFAKLGQKVAIKVHFGEKGNVTYLNPKFAKKVFERITGLGKEATLIECNVLYKGSRVTKTVHIKTAREHGFDMPIDILDGEDGSEYAEINGCKVGEGIKKFDSLVVLTHFKGHMAAGFGGSIKNIGMGLGSRAGKLDMHSTVRPSIISEKCIGCGVCIENCNAEAITLSEGKAKVDEKKCEGCAMCIAVCENGAVNIPWQGRTSEELQKKMAQYASAILGLFSGRVLFINVLQNITEECDCMGVVQKPIMKNVGILVSGDIVAIDKASLDLAEKHSGGKFGKINSVNKNRQIELAEEMKLGSAGYELVKV